MILHAIATPPSFQGSSMLYGHGRRTARRRWRFLSTTDSSATFVNEWEMPSLSSSAQPPPQLLTSRTRNSGTHTLGPKKNQRKRKVPIVSVVIDAESMEAASNWLSLGLAAWSSGSAGTRAAAKDGAARVELIALLGPAAAAMDGSGGKRTAVEEAVTLFMSALACQIGASASSARELRSDGSAPPERKILR